MDNETAETLNTTELPVPEVQPDHQLPEHSLDKRPDTEMMGAMAAELPQTGGAPDPAASQAAPSLGANPLAAPDPVPSAVPATTSTPVIADDDDLIEKEWVQKAKAIVASTKNDPYRQNKEISSYKADYIKKRFNKDVKATEG